jgi:hypothetical protein
MPQPEHLAAANKAIEKLAWAARRGASTDLLQSYVRDVRFALALCEAGKS